MSKRVLGLDFRIKLHRLGAHKNNRRWETDRAH